MFAQRCAVRLKVSARNGKGCSPNGSSACCGRGEAGNGKLTYFIGRHRGEKLNKLHRVTSVCMPCLGLDLGSEETLQLQGRAVHRGPDESKCSASAVAGAAAGGILDDIAREPAQLARTRSPQGHKEQTKYVGVNMSRQRGVERNIR